MTMQPRRIWKNFSLRPLAKKDAPLIRQFMQQHWGDDLIVMRGDRLIPSELPAYAAEEGESLIGLVTFRVEGDVCDLVTLDSLQPGCGVGSALIAAVEEVAFRAGCRQMRIVTTNDNLPALGFYQKRGYRLAALRPNALEESRKVKPCIPQTGMDGIPLRDELELLKNLT